MVLPYFFDSLLDLSALDESRLQELLDQMSMQTLRLNGSARQKVVQMSEVKNYIEQGWEFIYALPSAEAIVRLPAR